MILLLPVYRSPLALDPESKADLAITLEVAAQGKVSSLLGLFDWLLVDWLRYRRRGFTLRA